MILCIPCHSQFTPTGPEGATLSSLLSSLLPALRPELGPLLDAVLAAGSTLRGYDLLGAVVLAEVQGALGTSLPGETYFAADQHQSSILFMLSRLPRIISRAPMAICAD